MGGCVRWDAESEQAWISFTSGSRALVDDVARLLLRFNVLTAIDQVADGSSRCGYRLRVCGTENQLRFLGYVGVCGPASTQAAVCRQRLAAIIGGAYIDTVPREIFEHSRSEGRSGGSGVGWRSRFRAGRVGS